MFQLSSSFPYRAYWEHYSFPDKVRGVFNEGGLFGERQGWHLPGFDTSNWTAHDLSAGLPSGGTGVGFFVTSFDLSFPRNTDVFLSFQFESTNTQAYRALLFVNGWMYGKVRVSTLNPSCCDGRGPYRLAPYSASRTWVRRRSSLCRQAYLICTARSEYILTYKIV